MNDSQKGARGSVRQNAQKHFASSEQRDADLRQELESQRAMFDAKSARLRALRLEKEAAENPASAASENAPAVAKRRPRRIKRITP